MQQSKKNREKVVANLESENKGAKIAEEMDLEGSGVPFGGSLGRVLGGLGRSWASLGGSWRGFWRLLAALGGSCQLLDVFLEGLGVSWRLLATLFGGFWRLLAFLGGSWQLLILLGGFGLL